MAWLYRTLGQLPLLSSLAWVVDNALLLFGCLFKCCYCKGFCFKIFNLGLKKKKSSLHQESPSCQTLGFVLFLILAGFVFQITESVRITLCLALYIPCKPFSAIEGNPAIAEPTAGYGQYRFEGMQIICSIYGNIWAAATARNYRLMWAIRSVYAMVCSQKNKNNRKRMW